MRFSAPSTKQKDAEAAAPARERNAGLELLVTTALKDAKDPTSRMRMEDAPRLDFKMLYHVAEPDKRGWREVLYLDNNDRPQTAWVQKDRPFELMTVESGW